MDDKDNIIKYFSSKITLLFVSLSIGWFTLWVGWFAVELFNKGYNRITDFFTLDALLTIVIGHALLYLVGYIRVSILIKKENNKLKKKIDFYKNKEENRAQYGGNDEYNALKEKCDTFKLTLYLTDNFIKEIGQTKAYETYIENRLNNVMERNDENGNGD